MFISDIGVPKTYYPFNHYSKCGFLLQMHSSERSRKQLVVCHGAEFENVINLIVRMLLHCFTEKCI